jgi:lipoprotein NlpD
MAGKPGYYTVKPGDTLVRIGLDHGQNWRDIARWNQIENANLIEVGQVLRVRPEPAAARPGVRPVDRPTERSGPAASAPPAGSASRAPAAASPAAAEASRETDSGPAELNWAWPAVGPVLQGFDEQRNKGVDIGGKAGDAVLAAADGRVVYAGSALRGYGNLVILKHNSTFLSAYAHNQTLLVKEDQVVKRGQRIAEMGSTDAERVQLHFEIRRDGKPVDPARYLPAR